jgi:hypothetical protein
MYLLEILFLINFKSRLKILIFKFLWLEAVFFFFNFLRDIKNRAAERNGSAEPRLRNPGLEAFEFGYLYSFWV